MDKNEMRGNGGNRPSGQTFLILLIAVTLSFFIYSMVRQYFGRVVPTEISYSSFLTMVEKDEISRVEWADNQITVYPKDSASLRESADPGSLPEGWTAGTGFLTVVPVNADAAALVERLYSHHIEILKKKPDNSGYILEMLLGVVLPCIAIFLVMNLMMRRMGGNGGGMMGVGRSNAKMYMQRETGVSFKDVAGEDEAKESLVEIVDFLHNPSRYTAIGAKLPKGALLVGPPGTGKTLLAKAVAGEAQVPFYSLTGSDFVEMFVGVGASRVRDLFRQAAQNAPCIVFIDEIDAIGKTRDTRYGGNDEREQTLNQLLSEMDGFDAGKGIMVMGATNRPEILDAALLRPGRFDRRIIVEKPDLRGRVNILKVHAKDVQLDDSVDFEEIALATSGAVGADLANMMNEAAITAVKHGRAKVNQEDIFEAVEVVLVGKEKKDRIMSKQERKIVSYHEVGHALVSAVQKDAEPVQKITIVPRTMGALGYVMQVPEEEKFLNTKAELHAMLVGFLAGRAAEELVFDTVTTGASNDIEKATRIARAMVTQYGMSEKFGLMGLATEESLYLSKGTVMNCGDDTATEVDREVMRILKECYEEAKRILVENRNALDRIAAFLIEKETITGREFMQIFEEVKKEAEALPAEAAVESGIADA
ncbi:ATP-dependent metallopeptidase FtsH/Yme1/Tma family protein [Oribacterium sp. oral taxon 102]|uniref:ATP-dependent zinc metalloprotease FtsH n=1 Tax=Oribacterium sp. oral taxon 102 TaxID=671214 RepID=UPI0015BE61C9|nr:ATP-dependent zinc metalloprotease FtsH [Oribacterium sp. oral taxon 102]NWO21868.1 ATP-dependent metallopeptidase FtsH/Yme1/Tma family protein [Oribacterium sp. oral taxon 102]